MRYIIFYVFLFIPYIILSQNLDQHVIATSGDYTKTENNTLSWTIGETLIETAKKDSFILTQGFQQGNLSVITLINKNEIIYSLKVYPNPVKNKLTIETTDKSLNYQLINTKGYLILNDKINNQTEIIDFSSLPKGTYILKFDNKETHKIIKY